MLLLAQQRTTIKYIVVSTFHITIFFFFIKLLVTLEKYALNCLAVAEMSVIIS